MRTVVLFIPVIVIMLACGMKNEIEVAAGLQDRDFMTAAAYSNLHAISAGEITGSRSVDSNIQSFGEEAEAVYKKAQEDLGDIARYFSYPLPSSPDAQHTALNELLLTLSGREFDSLYILSQINDLEKTKELYRNRMDSNSHGLPGNYTASYFPVLQKHLQEAKNIKQKINPD